MEGTGTFPHCAVLSTFVATMSKVFRAAAGEASFRTVSQLFKLKRKILLRKQLDKEPRLSSCNYVQLYTARFIHLFFFVGAIE